jgi:hypothetical protein
MATTWRLLDYRGGRSVVAKIWLWPMKRVEGFSGPTNILPLQLMKTFANNNPETNDEIHFTDKENLLALN